MDSLTGARGAHFSSSPQEVKHRILSFCPLEDLLQMERVDKCFYALVRAGVFWKEKAKEAGIDPTLPRVSILKKLLFKRGLETGALGRIRKVEVKELNPNYSEVQFSLPYTGQKILLPLKSTGVGLLDLASLRIQYIQKKYKTAGGIKRDGLFGPSTCGEERVFLSTGNAVRVWDLEKNKLSHGIYKVAPEINQSIIGCSQGMFFIEGYGEGVRTIRVYNAHNDQHLFSLQGPENEHICHLYYLDEENKLIGGWSKGTICIWDLEKRECFTSFKIVDEGDITMTNLFYYNDKKVFFGLDNGKVKVLDLVSNQLSTQFDLNDEHWSPLVGKEGEWKKKLIYAEGKFLFIQGSYIKIIDPQTQKCLSTLRANGKISHIANLDGILVTTADGPNKKSVVETWGIKKRFVYDPSRKTYDLPDELWQHVLSFCAPSDFMHFTSVNSHLHSLGRDEVFWKARAKQALVDETFPRESMMRRLLFKRACETQSLGRIHKISVKDLDRGYWGVQLSLIPIDKKNLFPIRKQKIGILDLESRKVEYVSGNFERAASPFATGDGKIFVANKNKIKVWDLSTKAYLPTEFDNKESVFFLGYGNEMLFSESDGSIKVWNSTSGKYLHSLEGPQRGKMRHLLYLENEKILIGGWFKGAITIWDPEKGECVNTFDLIEEGKVQLTDLFYYEDKKLFFGLSNGKIKVLDLVTKQVSTLCNFNEKTWRHLKKSQQDLDKIAYAEGKLLLPQRSEIMILDPRTQQCLDTLKASGPVEKILYKDGVLITVAFKRGKVDPTITKKGKDIIEVWGIKKKGVKQKVSKKS